MKKQTAFKLLFAILALMLLAPAASVVVDAFSASPVLASIGTIATLAIAYYTPSINIPNMHLHGVEKEIWTQYIADNLFKGVEFLKNCFRADEYVLQGKVVHIPQAGAKPSLIKNPTSFPLTVTKRTDTDVTYSLDEYATAPAHIPDADKVQLSYNKIDSVLGDHMGVLNEGVADNILISWAPSVAGNILRTTGSNYAAHTPAGTGTRKGLTLADVKRAKVALTKQKVPQSDRYMLMSEDMWSQLEDELKATNTRDYSMVVDPTTGVIAKLYGFSIMTTTNMPVYDNAGTPAVKAYGAAGAVSDNDCVLCYHKSHVELALGEIKFFERIDDPLYQGDIYSALVRMGGRKRYSSEAGIVAIVQVP